MLDSRGGAASMSSAFSCLICSARCGSCSKSFANSRTKCCSGSRSGDAVCSASRQCTNMGKRRELISFCIAGVWVRIQAQNLA